MSKLSILILSLTLVKTVIAAEINFTQNSAYSLCNRSFLYAQESFSVHLEPSALSQKIDTIYPISGNDIGFDRYDSLLVTIQSGKGEFTIEPDSSATTYYGKVDSIDFSKISHKPTPKEFQLKKGDQFLLLSYFEEGTGLIRFNGVVVIADIYKAKIVSEPILEWWVKPESVKNGWIHLPKGSYTTSKCKW